MHSRRETVYIEAVTASSGGGPDAVPRPNFGSVEKVPRDQIVLRLRAAGPLRTGPIPGVYEGESLSAHIYKWIRNRYRDRLKIDFSNGYSVILLKGDPWLCRFPVIYGEVTVTCERDLTKKFPTMVVSKPGEPRKKPILNLLLCIQNLPQGLANELSDGDLQAILNFFQFGHEFLNALNNFCRDDQLAMSGLVGLLIRAGVGSGMGRWRGALATHRHRLSPLLSLWVTGGEHPLTGLSTKIGDRAGTRPVMD
jgi:hypothetical protein